MRLQHICWAAAIALLASPILATDLYLATGTGCLVELCFPSLAIYRVDLDHPEPKLVGSGGGQSIVGFDPTRPMVFLSSSFFICCSVGSVDLNPKGGFSSGVSAKLQWTSFAFDSHRMFALQLTDLLEIDLKTGALTKIMPLGMLAELLAVDVEHQRVYVAAHPTGTINELRVIDLARKTMSGPIMPLGKVVSIVTEGDGASYIFDGSPSFSGYCNVFRLDGATNELTTFASGVLIGTSHLVIDRVDHIVYGTFRGDVVSFDLVTRTTKVVLPWTGGQFGGWFAVAGVVHNVPPRGRAVR
jgi:hypothetical protein